MDNNWANSCMLPDDWRERFAKRFNEIFPAECEKLEAVWEAVQCENAIAATSVLPEGFTGLCDAQGGCDGDR